MSKIYALMDCNNFFVSCERVFQPALEKVPVVVLSSNDGCVISRSQEAKDLGVPMGIPYFKWKDLLEKDKVKVFSSNFELYGDISDRVMQILHHFSDEVEVYSIDEAFLQFEKNAITLEELQRMRKTVRQWTRIPISIGIGPTKVLAKLANHIAKKQKQHNGVYEITPDRIDEHLENVSVGEVWGIGRASAFALQKEGIKTALQFKNAPDHWIKKNFTVRGLALATELRGRPCFSFDDAPTPKKGLVCSKSFGQAVTTFEELREAIVTYASRAAEKLRNEKERASYIYIFIRSSRFKEEGKFAKSHGIELAEATSFTPTLVKQAVELLKQAYQPGVRYTKAGVGLSHLSPEGTVQPTLFSPARQTTKEKELMIMLDKLNQRHGQDTIMLAGSGIKKKWLSKRQFLSPSFTTSLEDLPKAS